MLEQGVRLRAIGNILKLSDSLQKTLKSTEELTRDNTKIELVLAINYGSRDEIVRAVKKILVKGEPNGICF